MIRPFALAVTAAIFVATAVLSRPTIAITGLTFNRTTQELRLGRAVTGKGDSYAKWQLHCHWQDADGAIHQADWDSSGVDVVEARTVAVFARIPDEFAAVRQCILTPGAEIRFTFYPYRAGFLPGVPVVYRTTHEEAVRE